MNVNEKYQSWLEGYLRETIDTALEKTFKDLQIDYGDAKGAIRVLIDSYIKNQLDIFERKQR